jgi:hypothetical protein
MIEHLEFEDSSDRIAELRRQIAAGTYDTESRLSSAVDVILDDFEQGTVRPGEDRLPLPRKPR